MNQNIDINKKSDIIGKVVNFVMTAGVFAMLFILCLPVLLIFSEGSDGGITVWNFVGIAWLLVLVAIGHKVFKKQNNG